MFVTQVTHQPKPIFLQKFISFPMILHSQPAAFLPCLARQHPQHHGCHNLHFLLPQCCRPCSWQCFQSSPLPLNSRKAGSNIFGCWTFLCPSDPTAHAATWYLLGPLLWRSTLWLCCQVLFSLCQEPLLKIHDVCCSCIPLVTLQSCLVKLKNGSKAFKAEWETEKSLK